jgi:hypothetical protein
MAETMPGSFGLSISFSGESEDVEVPSDDSEEVDPNSGELPEGGVEIVRAARCMEIYSADIVDQPAANPSGLFQAMPEDIKPEEVPPVAPVEEVKVEEVTAELEVKGPEGTQNLPEEAAPAEAPVEKVEEVKSEPVAEEKVEEVVAAPAPVEDLPEEKLSSKLSDVVLNFENTKAEVINLRADIETAHRNLSALKAEVEKRDLTIAKLEEIKRTALRAVGLLPSDVELEIDAQAAPFNPVEAYAAAVEAGDKKEAQRIYAEHKSAIFAALAVRK